MAMQTLALDQHDGVESRKSSGVDACAFGCSFIVLSLCVLIVAILINGFLPEPLRSKDGANSSAKFTATRAFQDLRELSDIGPKVVGTYENDVVAVQFIKDEILKVIAFTQMDKNKIVYDVQKPSDCFTLNLKNFSRGLCYEDVTNIIVKIEPTTHVHETILLNCHFDSVPTSPGTSDDGLNCAVLLEILRILARSPKPLKKNVIFLFNGAEEAGLLASHGFITQHKWAENISVFINLEACGAGGREVLFQTGPGAYILPMVYAKSVPYPHGSVIGEELFQSGALPSDTDFRIFRDFGFLKGLDFAHYKNGYVYHTSSDDISHVSENVIQHTGSNILALVNAFMDIDNLNEAIAKNENKAVFFDLFGLFMVCYSSETATFINIAVLLFSVCAILNTLYDIFKNHKFKSISYHISLNFLFLIIGTVSTTFVLFGLARLLEWKGLIMLWFSNQWFIITYYGVAVLYTSTSIIKLRSLLLPSKLSNEDEAKLFTIITQIITTVLLSLGIIFGLRSTYVISISIATLSASHLLLNCVLFRNSTVGMKLIVYVVFNILPVLYGAYLCIQMFTLIIPMTGRIGVEKDSEMLIWIITQFVVSLLFANFIPLVLLVKNWWKIQVSAGIVYTIYVLFVFFNTFQSPFTNATPERFSILHVNRKFLSANGTVVSNAGYLITPMDRRTPYSMNTILEDHEFQRVGDTCDSDINCSFPSMYPYLMSFVNSSYWENGEKPIFPSKKEIHFQTTTRKNYKSYLMELSGPCLNDIIIVPLNNAKLITWSSFANNNKGEFLKDRLFARRWNGFESKNPWSFSLEFDVSSVQPNVTVFKLFWSAHFISNNTSHYSKSFNNLLNKFPGWTKVVSWVTDYEEFVFA